MDYFTDSRLSWQAKGIYTYVLANEAVKPIDLLHIGSNGIEGIKTAIRELSRSGYVRYSSMREPLVIKGVKG